MKRWRRWLVNRRIRRALDDAGWPQPARSVFFGGMTVETVRQLDFYASRGIEVCIDPQKERA